MYGETDEARSLHTSDWVADGSIKAHLLRPGLAAFDVDLGGGTRSVGLHSDTALAGFWDGVGRDVVYVDVTGLPHHAWAPLVASAVRSGRRVRVVYVEPDTYKRAREPHQLYDLSEAGLVIRQLPGFTSVTPAAGASSFVPILGFEDARFGFVLNEIEPMSATRVYPVIGVPGFRPEYPFEAYRANQMTLTRAPHNRFPRNVEFADASCPFRLYYTLMDIAARHPGEVMRVGLLGTKPHALGAVLYALAHGPTLVELVYDNPRRKKDRTGGTHRLWVYHLSAFGLPSAAAS